MRGGAMIEVADKVLGGKFPVARHQPLLHATESLQTSGLAVLGFK